MLAPDIGDEAISMSVDDMLLIDHLSHLAPELLALIFQQLSISERGCLGRTNSALAAIAASDEAWSDAWAAMENAPARHDPRASLRAAWTLSSVRWMPLPPSSGSGQPPPMWRQHFAAVSSGRYVIVHGGQGSDSMRTCAYDLTTATWHDVAEVRRITARSLYPPLYPPRKLPSAHLTSLTSPYFPHLTLPSALPSDLTLPSLTPPSSAGARSLCDHFALPASLQRRLRWRACAHARQAELGVLLRRVSGGGPARQ